MTFARQLLLAVVCTAPAMAQQPDVPPPDATPVAKPAPIVRTAAKPAANGSAPTPIHLSPKPAVETQAAQTPASAKPAAATNAPVKPAQPAVTPAASPGAPLPVALNRTTVVIDPAHGGADSGSRITDSLAEKDVTLALAFKLRSLLSARGFNVVLTRDADAVAPPLSLDDRAGIANHARPVACLLLHATDAGRGVHLYTSELPAAAMEPSTVPWLTAQAAYVPQSQRLAAQLSSALNRAHIPVVTAAASVRPVDSLQCPALVVELAPNDGNEDTLSDGNYQQRVADALSGALVFWQNQAQPIVRQPPPVVVAPPPAVPDAAAPKPAATDGVQP